MNHGPARRDASARRHGARLSAVLCCTLFCTLQAVSPGLVTAQEDDAALTRERLKELENSISALIRSQRRDEQQRGNEQGRLRTTEEAISALNRDLRATRSQIAANREAIVGLQTQRAQLQANVEAQRDAVRSEVRRAYEAGSRDELRMLLSEEDPQQLSRMLAYYRRVVGARRELLDGFRSTLAELEAVDSQLSDARDALDAELARQESKLEELDTARSERMEMLAVLEQRIANQAEELASQEEERGRLEDLLAEIEALTAQLLPDFNVEPFSAARGKMPWPVEGTISNAYGRPRAQGKLRWQGVRMQAEEGAMVSAIHHGRVVYADWLRGSGLLLVIDHGEGFMSLYAHNESLLREVGDWVNTGAAVSTVGSTGGQREAGLYFEIRKDGKPTNPARWCRG
ncbi:MAG: peptidoglycan DD-metalloendopeptidase family protein [Pseudomonadota bacterium]